MTDVIIKQERFDLLEKVCVDGRAVFFIVGMALGEIKREELFKLKGFENFEAYSESIGYTRRHCNQLIVEAEVVNELPAPFRTFVQSERAARELAKLPAILRPAVIEEASQGGKKKVVTGGDVRKASPPPRKPAPAPKASTPPPRKPAKTDSKPVKELPKDETGLEIPKEALAGWARGQEAQELLTYISAIRSRIKKAQDSKDLLFVEVDFTDDLAKLNQVYIDLQRAKPYAICPTCQGKLAKDCMSCKGRGFVSQFYWEHMVPEETRKLRGGK